MSRPVAAIAEEQTSLLPPGWLWPRRPGSTLDAVFLTPLSVPLAEVEANAERMMDEIDPRTTVLCIDDWERMLGPDPCGRDTASMPLFARQQLAHQRWTARGGASIPYFVDLARRRGVAIRIVEHKPTEADRMTADDELIDDPEQFVWEVRLGLTRMLEFTADESEAEDYLYEIAVSDVECDIRRLKPAHTEVVFNYVTDLSDGPSYGQPMGLLLGLTYSRPVEIMPPPPGSPLGLLLTLTSAS